MKRLWERITDYIIEENYKALLKLGLAITPIIFLIGILIFGFVTFIGSHIEIFGILGIAILAIIGFFTSSKKSPEPVKPVQETGSNNILFFDKLLTRGLYDIFKEFSTQLHVITPTKFLDLKDDLPSCFDPVKGCNIYRYKIMSDGTEIEEALFRELLTSKIESALSSQKLSLGKVVVEYQGRLYPRVYIDEIQYVSGAWHIVLIICDTQEAANYIDSRAQCRAFQNNALFLDMRDEDFE